jgi:hypothetical protein
MFLKWDEVRIGEGVMDYDTYLRRVATLPADTPCFCEHLSCEGGSVVPAPQSVGPAPGPTRSLRAEGHGAGCPVGAPDDLRRAGAVA